MPPAEPALPHSRAISTRILGNAFPAYPYPAVWIGRRGGTQHHWGGWRGRAPSPPPPSISPTPQPHMPTTKPGGGHRGRRHRCWGGGGWAVGGRGRGGATREPGQRGWGWSNQTLRLRGWRGGAGGGGASLAWRFAYRTAQLGGKRLSWGGPQAPPKTTAKAEAALTPCAPGGPVEALGGHPREPARSHLPGTG